MTHIHCMRTFVTTLDSSLKKKKKKITDLLMMNNFYLSSIIGPARDTLPKLSNSIW